MAPARNGRPIAALPPRRAERARSIRLCELSLTGTLVPYSELFAPRDRIWLANGRCATLALRQPRASGGDNRCLTCLTVNWGRRYTLRPGMLDGTWKRDDPEQRASLIYPTPTGLLLGTREGPTQRMTPAVALYSEPYASYTLRRAPVPVSAAPKITPSPGRCGRENRCALPLMASRTRVPWAISAAWPLFGRRCLIAHHTRWQESTNIAASLIE
ncbi:hypothetical protein CALVIDRAFT_127559 [Calocera viscosa TUFC12733]|uniref:Uncharacterized protein n=1 Tax=Calocera viscosa (strain TUFC12733) TaxID=1330018 RepID=A0A167RSB9_CALVF|nr:hypothetical protein CALVIDRAFT_127559 [Calocera viscosa TUFC12733]